MADLTKTQAQWTRFWTEIAMFLLELRISYEAWKRYTHERTQVVVLGDGNDATPAIAGLTLSGVVYGVNTTAAGEIIVRLTFDDPDWDVVLYKATGGGSGNRIAQAQDVSAGGSADLSALNDSGVSGRVTLGANVSASSNDALRVLPFVDPKLRAPTVWDQADGVDQDATSRDTHAAMLGQLAAAERSKQTAIVAALTRWAVLQTNSTEPRGNTFLEADDRALVTNSQATDDGAVSISFGGFWQTLLEAMRDESTATQYVVKRTMAAAAGVFDSNNDGLGAVASHTPLERSTAGRYTFRCTRGADDGAVGEETFSGFFRSEDGLLRFPVSGLRVGRTWQDKRGATLTLTRTLSKTGDDSNEVFVAATSAVVTGESSRWSDSGTYYWVTTANGGNWDIDFYRSSGYGTTNLVASASNVATGQTFTAEARNGSSTSISWQLGGTESATSGTLKLNPFKRRNSTGGADTFHVVVSETNAGVIQTLLAEVLAQRPNDTPAQVHSTTSGSETIPDALVTRGTYVDFLPAATPA